MAFDTKRLSQRVIFGRGYEQVGRAGCYVGEWLCARAGSRCVSRCCQRFKPMLEDFVLDLPVSESNSPPCSHEKNKVIVKNGSKRLIKDPPYTTIEISETSV